MASDLEVYRAGDFPAGANNADSVAGDFARTYWDKPRTARRVTGGRWIGTAFKGGEFSIIGGYARYGIEYDDRSRQWTIYRKG
jgi:hypothetical protein